MVPLEPWRNFTQFLDAAAICTTKIDNFRASLTLTLLMTWSTVDPFIKEDVIEVDQLEETNNGGHEVDHVEETNSGGH